MSASATPTETLLGEREIVIKRGKGRPITSDYKAKGPEYFAAKFRERNILIQCDCGCSVKRNSMSDHLKTLKHMYIVALAKMNSQNV